MPTDPEKAKSLAARIAALGDYQIQQVEKVIAAFERGVVSKLLVGTTFDDKFLRCFGSILLVHHSFSTGPFTKDKFEYAMVIACREMGKKAQKSSTGKPGDDLTVEKERWSLKTQADKGIKRDSIHISKFMELGKGKWETVDDLPGLTAQMLAHMEKYDRIFTMRCHRVSKNLKNYLDYELIEIPKTLLLEVTGGKYEMVNESKQNPKPGYCTVAGKFALYFDGGGERKLQVVDLKVVNCTRHAEWLVEEPQ